MDLILIREIVLILVFAFFGGILAKKFRQPAIIGYLFSGFVLSLPFFSGIIDFKISRDLAKIGIALLLFTTGLEFPVSKFIRIKKSIFITALVQIVTFIFISTFVFSKTGFSKYESFFLAIAFSNSATIIVLQMIEKNKQIDTKVTDIIVSWLVIQDVIMVALTLLTDVISESGSFNLYIFFDSIAKSAVFIISSIILGKSVIPNVFNLVSKANSSELLLILAFSFCMIIAYTAEAIGLSFALGAFFAGMMISESFVNHEVFSEVKPLRDLFSVLFFVSLGTLVSPDFFVGNIIKIFLVLTVLLLLKFITSFIVSTLVDKQSRIAFVVSLILNQGGEFSFILSQMGLASGWISEDFYSLNIIISMISLMISPIVINNAFDWYYKIRDYIRKKAPRLYRYIFIKMDRIIDIDQPNIDKHVVICGFGRVGMYVGRALTKASIPFIVIDTNPDIVDFCKQRGIRVIFGDASNLHVLEKADVERAIAIVIALPEESACEIIAANARLLNESIKIIARSHIPSDDQKLKIKGVNVTVEPEFETAVSISKKILNYYGKSELEINKYLRKSRRRQRSKLGESN